MTTTPPTERPIRHWLDQAGLAKDEWVTLHSREWKAACGATEPLPLYFVRHAFRVTCPSCLPIAQRDEAARTTTP